LTSDGLGGVKDDTQDSSLFYIKVGNNFLW